MSLHLTSAVFATMLLASFIVAPAATKTSQLNNDTSLPVKYSAKILPKGDNICPSTDEQEASFAEIDQEINTLIRNTVMPILQCPGINPQHPAVSCLEITECDPRLPSGYYWINTTTHVQVYCDMDMERCSNGTGGWTRVTFLNMTDPTQQCLTGWTEVTDPARSCSRMNGSLCSSVEFNTHGIQYTHVLGRAIGYEKDSPDAFDRSLSGIPFGDINTPYVDGMSITHGMPREHIWTFAGHHAELNRCPCDSNNYTAPSFVGEDYFCEEGGPFWDGEGCSSSSSPCCTYNNPPWFCKQLPQVTTDEIEIRLCADQSIENENVPINLLEIYIQ